MKSSWPIPIVGHVVQNVAHQGVVFTEFLLAEDSDDVGHLSVDGHRMKCQNPSGLLDDRLVAAGNIGDAVDRRTLADAEQPLRTGLNLDPVEHLLSDHLRRDKGTGRRVFADILQNIQGDTLPYRDAAPDRSYALENGRAAPGFRHVSHHVPRRDASHSRLLPPQVNDLTDKNHLALDDGRVAGEKQLPGLLDVDSLGNRGDGERRAERGLSQRVDR